MAILAMFHGQDARATIRFVRASKSLYNAERAIQNEKCYEIIWLSAAVKRIPEQPPLCGCTNQEKYGADHLR